MTIQAWSLALAMAMTFVFTIPDVHASNSELPFYKAILEKSLGEMTCEDSNDFIQQHHLVQTPTSPHDHDAAAGTGVIVDVDSNLKDILDNCTEAKQRIRSSVLQSSLPLQCTLCEINLCLSFLFCQACCDAGYQPVCFFCF